MTKRFTDTNKWLDAWFRNLKPEHKLLWFYICDSCDYMGLWKVDFEFAEFSIKCKYDIEEVKQVFGDKIEIRTKEDGEYWFIKDFIRIQYGEDLSDESKIHKKILEALKGRKTRKKEETEEDKKVNDVIRELIKYFGDWYQELFKHTYNCKFEYEWNLIKKWVKFYQKEYQDLEKVKLFLFDLVDIYFNEIIDSIEKNFVPNPSIGKFHKQLNRLVVIHRDKTRKIISLEKYRQQKGGEKK
jgi:hypothetical protein